MSYEDNLESLQRTLKLSGYESIRHPVDISALVKDDSVHDCEIMARKDYYNILYMEARSNWRGIATDVAKKQAQSCLVITGYGTSHLILSAIKNYATSPKPRHVIIDTNSRSHSFDEFAKLIKVTQDDDTVSIDTRIHNAFDEYATYKEALDEFAVNLKNAIKNTRETIIKASKNNKRYDAESEKFLEMCHKVISSKLKPDDVTEMLLQHVLTYRIFSLIYDEHKLHSTNAVARSLEGMVDTLGIDMEQMSAGYQTIKLVAESITDSAEKQDFLKRVYETFYSEYDPRNKDNWGIAYTPSEVVDFMVRSTDYLLEKHFGKSISDDCVTMLDPATGTGTFVTSILRHLKPGSLETKYKNDIFANDISILAYYIAALNIENTYQEMTGKIKEFENICWMDTLATGTKDFGKVSAYFESQDNVKRISKQQIKDICVVLGNPPYNAVQVSFNDANPADKYPDIDAKIAETYVRNSSAKLKASAYDMYLRFMKWSSERIKTNGMVVFVSNNSFLEAKASDGFRKSVFEEFDYIYTVNLKGNARLAGDAWKREGGKIFGQGARVGVAISFFVKTGENRSEIQYAEIDDYVDRENKLKWLADNSLSTLPLRQIVPNKDVIWLNQTDNDFDELVPVVSDEENSIFELRTHGASSGRDDWVYDFDEALLENKIKYFISIYNKSLQNILYDQINNNFIDEYMNKNIKWSADLLKYLKRRIQLTYSGKNTKIMYRPFVFKFIYFDKFVIERPGHFSNIVSSNQNKIICFSHPKNKILFQTLASNTIMSFDCIIGTQCIPLYTYDDSDKPCSNVTKFGLELFQKYYRDKKITDKDIFYYTYAVFNDPKYQETYKYNLQRKFPRIPLAENFMEWARIGKKLYDLHVNFEDVKPYPLERINKKTSKNNARLKLQEPSKSDNTIKLPKIIIDDKTTLDGIPNDALQYKFSSKCALEWILEFYKESKNVIRKESCIDLKIREKFSTYKFADHKEHVIDLLQKATTVSVETMNLRQDLENMSWGKQSELYLKKSSTSSDETINKLQMRKIRQSKKPKKSKKGGRKSEFQDTLDGIGQKRLF